MESGTSVPPEIFHERPEFKMFMDEIEKEFCRIIEEARATRIEIEGLIGPQYEAPEGIPEREHEGAPSPLQMTLPL